MGDRLVIEKCSFRGGGLQFYLLSLEDTHDTFHKQKSSILLEVCERFSPGVGCMLNKKTLVMHIIHCYARDIPEIEKESLL